MLQSCKEQRRCLAVKKVAQDLIDHAISELLSVVLQQGSWTSLYGRRTSGLQGPQVKAANALKGQALKRRRITSIILSLSKQPWPAKSPWAKTHR